MPKRSLLADTNAPRQPPSTRDTVDRSINILYMHRLNTVELKGNLLFSTATGPHGCRGVYATTITTRTMAPIFTIALRGDQSAFHSPNCPMNRRHGWWFECPRWMAGMVGHCARSPHTHCPDTVKHKPTRHASDFDDGMGVEYRGQRTSFCGQAWNIKIVTCTSLFTARMYEYMLCM